jgi:hypothetical protein
MDLGDKIFLLQAILSCVFSKFWEAYTPPAIHIRVNHQATINPVLGIDLS